MKRVDPTSGRISCKQFARIQRGTPGMWGISNSYAVQTMLLFSHELCSFLLRLRHVPRATCALYVFQALLQCGNFSCVGCGLLQLLLCNVQRRNVLHISSLSANLLLPVFVWSAYCLHLSAVYIYLLYVLVLRVLIFRFSCRIWGCHRLSGYMATHFRHTRALERITAVPHSTM